MFYNTTKLKGNELKAAEETAKTQEEIILEFFESNRNLEASPETVQILNFSSHVPLTSIRRGVTNLTNDGKLLKTEKTEVGRYGAKTHLWTLKK
jgi:hypothetical protein